VNPLAYRSYRLMPDSPSRAIAIFDVEAASSRHVESYDPVLPPAQD